MVQRSQLGICWRVNQFHIQPWYVPHSRSSNFLFIDDELPSDLRKDIARLFLYFYLIFINFINFRLLNYSVKVFFFNMTSRIRKLSVFLIWCLMGKNFALVNQKQTQYSRPIDRASSTYPIFTDFKSILEYFFGF